MSDLKEQYITLAQGHYFKAAARFIEDLMAGDEVEMKAGYTLENAIIAALEVFGAEAIAQDALRVHAEGL